MMKIPNKRELQQIALNHSSDIDFKDFMNIYKKSTKEPYSFLVNDTTLPSDDPLRFRKNLLGLYIIKIMTIEDQIKDEKLQYDIHREAAKVSVLSSGKLDKYEYLTGGEILPSNQQQIIQQAKFNYSPLGKAIEKQIKTIKDQGEKQVVALESLKPPDKKLTSIKDFIPTENVNPEIINEIKRIEEIEKKVDRNRMVYKGTNKTYDFRNFKTIRAFGNEIRNNIISLDTANIEQANLLSYINDYMKTKPRDPEKRKLRADVLNSVTGLVNGREMVLTAFKSGIFQVSKESQEGKGANEMSRVNASE